MNQRFWWWLGRGLAALVFALGLQAASARAATITVTTTADEFGSGVACSLREAVRTANGNADFGSCAHSGGFGTDLILLPPGTYELTIAGIDEDADATADLDILSSLTISATGSTPTIRGDSGGYSGRLVHVHSPAVATIKNLTPGIASVPVPYTHLRAHETVLDLVCPLLLEHKNRNTAQRYRPDTLHIPRKPT